MNSTFDMLFVASPAYGHGVGLALGSVGCFGVCGLGEGAHWMGWGAVIM